MVQILGAIVMNIIHHILKNKLTIFSIVKMEKLTLS